MPRREIVLMLESVTDEEVIRDFIKRQSFLGVYELLCYLEYVNDASYNRWIGLYNAVMGEMWSEPKETGTTG